MAKLLLGSVVGPQGPQGESIQGPPGPQGAPGPSEVSTNTDIVGIVSGQVLYNKNGKVGGKILDYMYGDPVAEFENFDPINAQFLGGNAPNYYAPQSALTSGLNAKIDKTSIVNNLTTGGETSVLSAQQGVELNSAIGQIAVQKDEVKTTNFNPDGSITEVTKVGSTTIRTKTTTFPSATQIVDTMVENGITTVKTITFNPDGTITEGVV